MTIDISIVNKRPTVIGTPIIVCGNSDYTVAFTFDDEWASAALKTARFVYVQAGAVKYQDVVFSGSTVSVPVLSNIREVFVGVYAGELHTTTPARIPCDRSILCGSGTEHEEPAPDVYNQILEACNALVAQSANHLTDKNNPHGVTIDQIGAAPASHTEDKNNPHGVTIDQIGAAPAGYGLGGAAYTSDFNTCLSNGWYYGTSATANAPSGFTTNCSCLVVARTGSQVYQYFFYPTNGCVLQRYTTDGGTTWTEEWMNPPLAPGVLYRTTERHNGKAVYAVLIDCGTLPNTTSKSVTTTIPGTASIVSASGMAINSSGLSQDMPVISSSGSVQCAFFITAGRNININAFIDMSAYTGHIIVKYTID